MNTLTPLSGVCRNPIVGMKPSEMARVPCGVPIVSLAPKARGLLVCRVNGEWLSRESWESETIPGDVIEWYDIPQDADTALRTVLSIGAVLFLGPLGLQLQGLYLVAAVIATQLAINALLPPNVQSFNRPGETGQNFTASLSGNQARLDQAIWKTCGRREITPPFACMPYLEYRPKPDAEDPQLDNDQYYFALFAVGIGNHNEPVVKIGNTPITRFDDVLIAEYLPPGQGPISVTIDGQTVTVLANVTTAQEVSGQVLESGQYVGGFAACSARRLCKAIGIDVVATRGLGKTDPLTVTWRVEYRRINDFGQVLSTWRVLASESRTAFTSTPQRWSNRYELPTVSRVEVRLVRTDIKDEEPGALHEIAWAGLRGYMNEPASLNPHTAHYQVVMRASSQLSDNASKSLRLIVEAKTRTWSPTASGDGWGPEIHTRNPAWWMLDLATSDTWGINKPDERVDLQSFYELAQKCDQRQDRFDWTFDSANSAWEALQLIARSCRSRVFRRNGVLTVARDELADVPVTAFTPRNCKPGVSIREQLRQRNSPDGYIIEYQDHRTWEWTDINCPCPGVSVMQNPVRRRLEGVTGLKHAQREGRYEAAVLLYRQRTISWKTEMEGILPSYMSPVEVQPDIMGYGQSGDVVAWDLANLQMWVTEPPDWSLGTLYLTLIRDDGTLTTPVAVVPGTDTTSFFLPAAPDFPLTVDNALRERPKYLLGKLEGSSELVKVMSISDGGDEDGAQLYSLTGVIDDERVHTADVSLLPGPGETQDPVGDPNDSDGSEGGGDVLPIPYVANPTSITVGAPYGVVVDRTASITFQNNGLIKIQRISTTTQTQELSNQWSRYGEVEPAAAATMQVRVDNRGAALNPVGTEVFSGTLGTWQSLGTDRTFSLTVPAADTSGITGQSLRQLRVRIREADTGIVQTDAFLELAINHSETPGGD